MARETQLRVEIDTGGSVARLKELRAQIDETRQELGRARASNDPAAVKAAKARLADTRRELHQLKGSMREAAAASQRLDGDLSKMSRNQVQQAYRAARRELNAMTRGTREYAERLREVQRLEGELARIRAQQRGGRPGGLFAGLTQGVKGFAASITTALGPVMAVVAAIGAAIGAISRATAAHAALQERTKELQSLTGLAGRDIDWLKEKAQEMATSTTAAGVRITKGAEQIVEAFTLMGSAKPELLGNRDALAQATEAALTLAEAAKMETADAVQALASTMNQFGAGAEESGRYINALAAGAKAGSASVSDISKSIVKFGATASMANLSVEESVGLIETLAAKGIKGEVAGTGLNAVLLRLQTGADEFNPRVVGLNQALENLGAANLSVAQKAQLFGQGNIAVGETLIAMRGQVAQLTEAVTGTDEATLQAANNTDTLTARLAQMGNTMQNRLVKAGEVLAPLVETALDFFDELASALGALWGLIGPLVESTLQGLRAVISLMGGLLRAVTSLTQATTVTSRYTEALLRERDALDAVFSSIRNTEKGTKAHTMAIEQINQQYGKYLPQLLDEHSSLEQIAQAQRIATQALEHNTLAKQRASELDQIEEQRLAQRRKAIKGMSELIAKRMGQNEQLYQQRLRDALAIGDETERLKALNQIGREIQDTYQTGQLSGFNSSFDFARLISSMTQAEEEAARMRAQVEREFDLLGAHVKEPVVVRITPQVEPPTPSPQPKGGSQPAGRTASAAPPKEQEEKAYRDAETLLNQWYQTQRAQRLQAHARAKGDKKALERDLHALELTYLIKRKADLDRFGKSSAAVQEQIARKEIQIAEAKEAERLAIEKAAHDARQLMRAEEVQEVQDGAEADAAAWHEAHQQRMQSLQQTADQAQTLAQAFGDLIGECIADANASMADFGRRAAMMALDALHKTVRAAIASIWAQSLASADSIATFGISGIAKATALTVMVEGAFAAAKTALTPQRQHGKLWARGQDDHRLYHVPYIGSPRGVTYVDQPALISEQGGEIIIDHARSVAIRTRYPWLLQEIARIPQHAAGTLPRPSGGPAGGAEAPPRGWRAAPPPAGETPAQALRELQHTLRTLNDTLSQGLTATIAYRDLRDTLRRGQAAEQPPR